MSFVGSSCTPAVYVVPSIKIIEGTHGLQYGKGVSPVEEKCNRCAVYCPSLMHAEIPHIIHCEQDQPPPFPMNKVLWKLDCDFRSTWSVSVYGRPRKVFMEPALMGLYTLMSALCSHNSGAVQGQLRSLKD